MFKTLTVAAVSSEIICLSFRVGYFINIWHGWLSSCDGARLCSPVVQQGATSVLHHTDTCPFAHFYRHTSVLNLGWADSSQYGVWGGIEVFDSFCS